jgi:hypothetical protein
MRVFILPILLFMGQISLVQAQNAPCSSPKASEFDFWVGDWELTWGDTLHGKNRIEKMFGNCTIHENFEDPKTGFLGQSWSVYNSNYNQWQQTWVDNNGGYIVLTGGMAGDTMVLITAERTVPERISLTRKMQNRMLYYNIKNDSFDWDWQVSTDGGITWKSNWKIHYDRRRSN